MKQHLDRYFADDFVGRQETTIRAHRLWLGRFVDRAGNKIDSRAYAEWVRYSFATWGDQTARNFAIACAARFLNWCERQRLIEKSPHKLVRLPEPAVHDPREPFTATEYAALLSVADLRASFCSALANGGMNLAAACRLSGHKDPGIFLKYVTGDVEQLREQMVKARSA